MNIVINRAIRLYELLLCLYPKAFRNEFAEQMLLDFSDLLNDADRKGGFSIVQFCMREAFDFPVSLLRVHIQQGSVFQILRSTPVKFALRGALGYGVVFGLAILIGEFVSVILYNEGNSIIGNLQVFFFDLFHTENGLELIGWIPNAIASLLSGLVLGILFAVLFADRPKYGRYILAGMLGWFLHHAVISILLSTANLGFFLGTRHTTYLSRMESALSGAFLALIFIAARSKKGAPLWSMVVGSFAYPLIAYFYVKLLFKLSVIETPWMFMALMILMVVYIGSVLVLALRSDTGRNAIWLVATAAIAYVLLPYAGQKIIGWLDLLIPFTVITATEIPVGSVAFWQLMLRRSLDSSIYGLIFGLIMGLIFGLLNKSKAQIAAARGMEGTV